MEDNNTATQGDTMTGATKMILEVLATSNTADARVRWFDRLNITAKELRAFCASNGLDATGNRSALAYRVAG